MSIVSLLWTSAFEIQVRFILPLPPQSLFLVLSICKWQIIKSPKLCNNDQIPTDMYCIISNTHIRTWEEEIHSSTNNGIISQ